MKESKLTLTIKSEKSVWGKKSYPCFRWNSDPCYIHVVVQQVEFGLQRQDETVGEHVSTINNKQWCNTVDI